MVQAKHVFFTVNTVLMGAMILYFWLFFLPAFEYTNVYGTIQTITIILTVCMIGAYIASSLVILGKV
ncbi:MAG: hypothetical protein QW057_05210 [Candidatus Bathyarchaeia archaeon]